MCVCVCVNMILEKKYTNRSCHIQSRLCYIVVGRVGWWHAWPIVFVQIFGCCWHWRRIGPKIIVYDWRWTRIVVIVVVIIIIAIIVIVIVEISSPIYWLRSNVSLRVLALLALIGQLFGIVGQPTTILLF